MNASQYKRVNARRIPTNNIVYNTITKTAIRVIYFIPLRLSSEDAKPGARVVQSWSSLCVL